MKKAKICLSICLLAYLITNALKTFKRYEQNNNYVWGTQQTN